MYFFFRIGATVVFALLFSCEWPACTLIKAGAFAQLELDFIKKTLSKNKKNNNSCKTSNN